MKLIGIVGNNARYSYNRILLKYIARHFNAKATIDIVEIAKMPLFNEDLAKDNVPESVTHLISHVNSADGVIIATPEYDHAVTASLKSSLEWLSYVDHPLEKKPVMIVGTSLSQQGTSFAQTQLREILNSPGLNARVLSGNEFMLGHAKNQFNENGELVDSRTVSFLEQCFNNFLSLTVQVVPEG